MKLNNHVLLEIKNIIEKNVLFVVLTAVGLVNLFFFDNAIIQITNTAAQLLILFYCFCKNNYMNYFLFLLGFVSVSYELDVFLPSSAWYGLLNIELFNINIVFYLSLLLLFLLWCNKKKILNSTFKADISKKMIFLFCFTITSSIIMGMVVMLINDNNIVSMTSYILSYFQLCYFYIFTIILVLSVYFILKINPKSNILIIKKSLINILVVICIITIASFLFSQRIYYDSYTYLLTVMSSFFVPILIILPFYCSSRKRILLSILGILVSIFLVLFASSGKSIIILSLIPALLLFLYFKKNNKSMYRYVFVMTLLIIMAFAILVGLDMLLPDSMNIFSEKIHQVVSMMQFWSPSYIANLPLSPKCRVLEMINISYEYISKPWFFIFGKGYVGSFIDYTGLLSYIGNAFTQAQWDSGIFYLPHESFSRLLLNNGLIGLYFYFWILNTFVKNIEKSSWLFAGTLWFILFYGYSISLLFFGATCLVVGMFDVDLSSNRNYDVAVIDFLFVNGHRLYCNSFVNNLNSNSSTCVIDNGDYYDFNTDDNHTKLFIKSKSIPGKNFIDNRIRIIINIYKNIKAIQHMRFKKVIIMGYENTTLFIFLPILKKYGKIFIAQHHQIDELETSSFKKSLFKMYKNKVNHIVCEQFIKDSLNKDFGIDNNSIYVYPIPLVKVENKMPKWKKESRLIIALSNSNDESFVNSVYLLEKDTKFFEKHNIDFVIKCKTAYNDLSSIRFINGFLSDEEYSKLFKDSDLVIIPFPSSYINRASGSIIDALSMGKKVLCSEIKVTKYYSNRYPDLCFTYKDFEDFINKIENMNYNANEEQLNSFVSEHSDVYLNKCVEVILGGKK